MIGTPHIIHEHTYPDTERPYLPLLVVRPADVHPFPVRSYGIALLLDAPLSNKELASLHTLITGDRPFLLLLERYDSDVLEHITLSFFSPHYIRMDDAPVLAFRSAPPAGLILRLQQQGWSDIVQWNVSLIRRLTQRHEIPAITDAIFTGTSAVNSKYIFIQGKDLDDTLSLEQALHQHCSGVLNDTPNLRPLILQKQQMQTTLDRLEKERRVLQERLDNAETTVGIIRSKYKDDYDILFNWYQQEYEVLPLWYKRFGHLIKVLTGKRTAKSFFRAIHRRVRRWITFSRRPSSAQPDRTPQSSSPAPADRTLQSSSAPPASLDPKKPTT